MYSGGNSRPSGKRSRPSGHAAEKGKFFVGLSDILQALAFAEDEADVPEIPQEWWEEIGKLYSA